MARQVVGFVSVPSLELGGRRALGTTDVDELDLQRARISDYARERRWELTGIFDGVLEPDVERRPPVRPLGVESALERITDRRASALVVDRVERLTFFSQDLVALVSWLRKRSAVLVAIDDDLDPTRRGGQAVFDAFLAGASWAQRMTGSRIRAGSARARGTTRERYPVRGSGRLSDHPRVLDYIHRLHDNGLSLGTIAKQLDSDGFPTARGGRCWWPSTVASALRYPRPR